MLEPQPYSGREMPRTLVAATLLLLCAWAGGGIYQARHPVLVQDLVHWFSIPDSETEFKKGEKPLLYDFSADWCGPCQELKKGVFANKANADWINQAFVPVSVVDRKEEYGRNPPEVEDLQKQFNIRAFPTLAVKLPNGQFKTLEGYGGPMKTRLFLESQLEEFKKGQSAKK